MKNISKLALASVFCAGACLSAGAQNVPPAIPSDPVIEANIQEWLQKMTLEEKIGQMCEITIDVVTDFEASMKHGFVLDKAKLDTVIGKYKVGSLLNVPLSIAQPKEKWAEAIKQIQELSMKEIGIPCIYGVDQIHGTTYTLGGTFFPQGVNMGASFNRDLVKREAEISAYETKAGCIPWTYAPVVDLGRDPRWSRMHRTESCSGMYEALHGLWRPRIGQGPHAFFYLTERYARKALCTLPRSRPPRGIERNGQFGRGQRHAFPC